MKIIYIFFFLLILSVSCDREKKNYDKTLSIEPQYSKYMLDNLFNEEFVFPDKYKVINLEGDSIMFKSLLDSPKIIIRLTEGYCESCIIEQINLINSSIESPQNTILGLATYGNLRQFKVFGEKYKINFPIYFIPHSDSEIIFSINDTYQLPYYFFIDSTLISKYIFRPYIAYPQTTIDYLKKSSGIINEYNSKNKQTLLIDERNLFIDNIIINKKIEIEIPYTNATSKDIFIDSVNVFCDCLKIISYHKLIKPSEKGKLHITYTPKNLGFDQKEIKFTIKDKEDLFIVLKMYVINNQ